MPSLGSQIVMRLVTAKGSGWSGIRRTSAALAVRLGSIISVAVAAPATASLASGRDQDGRKAASPLRDWFEHLASGKGLCGSFADVYVVADADWGTEDGHYRVRLP